VRRFAGIGAIAALAAAGAATCAAAEEPPALQIAPPTTIEIHISRSLPAEDWRAARELLEALRASKPIGRPELDGAEALYARHSDDEGLARLLEGLLARAASQAEAERRFDEALADLERASSLDPGNGNLRLSLVALWMKKGDWEQAEAVARDVAAREPRNAEAWVALGYSLLRQDRDDEARQALREALRLKDHALARSLLERLRKEKKYEKGLTEERLAHFNLRYDGEAYEALGRRILDVLEAQYAEVCATFSHQPAATIPVILLSKERYYAATDAPTWSGGEYDGFDGRIRIPVEGLTPAHVSDIEKRLVHEVTHAVVADLSAGLASRELQEGLAQYMEGQRTAALPPGARARLAEGRLEGVRGFYAEALAFVEYLIAQKGQAAINDALRRLGETGSRDQAFLEIYGRDYATLRAEWKEQIH
jgi:Flp pilus assembly protein TadD